MNIMKMKLKKDDTVKVIAGKDKGKEGKIIQVFPKLNKVVVDKINIYKKHLKSQQKGQSGQIIEFSAPLDASNVMLVCPQCGKATKVGYKLSADNKKVRMCKHCQKSI